MAILLSFGLPLRKWPLPTKRENDFVFWLDRSINCLARAKAVKVFCIRLALAIVLQTETPQPGTKRA